MEVACNYAIVSSREIINNSPLSPFYEFCILVAIPFFSILCFRELSVWSLKDSPLRTQRSLKELKGG